jgi:soluble lytic murein transglycosylase-like protein
LAELDGHHAHTVWTRDLAGRLTPFLDERRRRLRLAALVVSEARRAKLPPGLVMAVIEVESGFERFALSPAGARGLMQIMPFWRQRLDRAGRNGNPDDDLFRPAVNLRYGCTILRHYLERADGDIARALASYNGSAPGDGYVARVRRAYRERWAQP